MPGQAEQHRLVAAVAFAGGAERAVEHHLHAGRLLQQPVMLQPQPEQARGTHRAYRVGTARADADLEEVENGNGHGRPRFVRGRLVAARHIQLPPWNWLCQATGSAPLRGPAKPVGGGLV